jgi:hypothetical protein
MPRFIQSTKLSKRSSCRRSTNGSGFLLRLCTTRGTSISLVQGEVVVTKNQYGTLTPRRSRWWSERDTRDRHALVPDCRGVHRAALLEVLTWYPPWLAGTRAAGNPWVATRSQWRRPCKAADHGPTRRTAQQVKPWGRTGPEEMEHTNGCDRDRQE